MTPIELNGKLMELLAANHRRKWRASALAKHLGAPRAEVDAALTGLAVRGLIHRLIETDHARVAVAWRFRSRSGRTDAEKVDPIELDAWAGGFNP